MQVPGCFLVALFGVTSLVMGQEGTGAKARRIHVVVALCDNEHQGIQKVNPRIGDGDDLANNLYWGCSDGMSRYFRKAKEWKLIKQEASAEEEAAILETLVFEHGATGAVLTAEAWRGREIRAATERFLRLVEDRERGPDLVAYIGHNGLMDFTLGETPKGEKQDRSAIVLCCRSDAYFSPRLRKAGIEPILMTDQFMYPGSFLLKAAVDGWLRGESKTAIRERAARAYASNQKIGVKSARGVFTKLD